MNVFLTVGLNSFVLGVFASALAVLAVVTG